MPNFPFTVGDSLRIGTADITASGGNIVLPSGTQVGNQPVATTVEVSTGGGPKITNIQVTSNVYVVLDDTAVDTAGGFIKITGTNFVTGCMVYVASTPANSTTFVNSTEVRAAVPATSAGTYALYLVNPDGGTAIRVPGLTFSANPAWQTASTLPEQYDGVAINLSLVATEATLYTLVSGSLPPGLSLNSNTGVISGTVSGVANDTVYSFTITATDAQLQDSPRTFTVTITVSDPYFRLTTLLLSGSALSANTVVRDSSTNNFNITVSGDARASNFTPYGTGWSAYLSGSTTSGLTIAGTGSLLGSGLSYTFEGWFRFFATNVTDNHWIWVAGSYPNRWTIDINVQATTIQGRIVTENNAVLWSGSSVAYTFGSWVHISAVNNAAANTFTFYFNGINAGSTTAVSLLSYASHRIGIQATNVVHASSIRLVSGQALYTGNYTPGTATLTTSSVGTTGANVAASITGTVGYLLCHTNRFLDATGKSITISGTPQISSSNPFNITNTGVDGSAYFDGTGDYLSIVDNSAFTLANYNFCIELWIYPTASMANYANFLGQWANSTTNCAYTFRTSVSQNVQFAYTTSGNGQAGTSVDGSALVISSWNHIVVCRNGTTLSIFQNGVRTATHNISTNTISDSSRDQQIGFGTDGSAITGYMSNLRFVTGNSIYDPTLTALAVPTQPLTAVANTQLLTLQYRQPHNNHTFLDSSSNQFLITRNGNATQGTFSPFSQTGWGNYFSGGANYLSVAATTSIDLASSDFTIECWAYPGTQTNAVDSVFGYGNFTTMLYRNGTTWSWEVGNGSSANYFTITATVTPNTWQHIALTRSGNTFTFWINGSSAGTNSTANAVGTASKSLRIGDNNGGGTQYFTGYISNFRITKGRAVYTVPFSSSVPTAPLTRTTGGTNPPQGTECSLLTCQSNRFLDSNGVNVPASSPLTITANGSPTVVAFSPFATTAVYNPAVHGGSAYFDGSGDYVAIPISANLRLGNSDWSFECWVYTTNFAASRQALMNGQTDAATAGGSSYFFAIANTTIINDMWIGGVNYGINCPTPSLNSWNHIAYARTGGTMSAYLNGVRVSTRTDLGTLSFQDGSTTYTPVIGGANGGTNLLTTGYISNLRFIKGTGGFDATQTTITVPIAPVTATTNTQLLLNFTDAAILDSTGRNAIETVADAKTSSVQVKYGTGSMYFDGTGDRILSSTNPVLLLSTSDWTVEFWLYKITGGGINAVVCQLDNGSTYGTLIGYESSSNLLVYMSYSGSSWDIASGQLLGTVQTNTWVHYAVTRSGSTFRTFQGGIQQATWTNTSSIYQAANAIVLGNGQGFGSTTNLAGYVDDFRITRGYARYTANFTAPTASARLK